jgi:hypothetical protein
MHILLHNRSYTGTVTWPRLGVERPYGPLPVEQQNQASARQGSDMLLLAPPGGLHADPCRCDLRFPVGRLVIEGTLPAVREGR